MGREENTAFIGAIALGGIVFNILYWGFGFIRPGTTGIVAQEFGANNLEECYRYFFRSFLMAFIAGLLILLFHKPIGHFFFSFLNGNEQIKSLAYEYYSIRILSAPVAISFFAFRGWFFGMQNAWAAMTLTIFVNALNIILSAYFVLYLHWSVKGVALGTLLAEYITLFIAFGLLIYRYRWKLFLYLKLNIFQPEKMKRFLFINGDMFLRNMGLIFVFSYFTHYSAGVHQDYLAMNEILLQMFYLMSYSVDGFAYASESLVGRYIGERNLIKLKMVVRKCMIWGIGTGICFSLLFLLGGRLLMQAFTDKIILLQLSRHYFLWLALVSLCGAMAFIWDGIYSGATASKELRNSMFLSVGLFVLSFLGLRTLFPGYAIWMAMTVFMLSRSLFQIFFYKQKIISRFNF